MVRSKKGQSMKVNWGEIRSWGALLISVFALGIAFLGSPLSPFFKPLLRYEQHRMNYHKELGNPHNNIVLSNTSTTVAAKEVVVLIQARDKDTVIDVDAPHTVTTSDINFIVQIPSLAPGTKVSIRATTTTTTSNIPVATDVYSEVGHAIEDWGSLDGPKSPPFNRFVPN